MHDSDDYLLKVLEELGRRTTGESISDLTTGFQMSTLWELHRRILIGQVLKSEKADLEDKLKHAEGVRLGPQIDEDLQKCLQEEISKLRSDCESQLQEIQQLAGERDAASQRENESRQLIQDLQLSQDDLRAQNTRLSEENAHQVRRLRETDDINLQHLEDIDTLKRRLQDLQNAADSSYIRDAKFKSQDDGQILLSKEESLQSPFTKSEKRHDGDDDVIVLSSDEDITASKVMPPTPKRCTHLYAGASQPAQPLSKDREAGDHEGSSSDGERQDDGDGDIEAQHDSDHRLPVGLPLLRPQNLPLHRAISSPSLLRGSFNIPERDTLTIFNRKFLSDHLGGAWVALQVRIGTGKQKPVAKRFGITSFMCPNLDHNPWAPSYPGQDGYMFVGLGIEKDAFALQETHELFVQFATKKMFYAGKYSFQKVTDVTTNEWHGLDSKIKSRYCETTISKAKAREPVATVLASYNDGRLRAPCVFLRFLHFNLPLYNALSDAGKHTRPSISTSTLALHPPEKRKHGSDRSEPLTTPRRVKPKGLWCLQPDTPIDADDFSQQADVESNFADMYV